MEKFVDRVSAATVHELKQLRKSEGITATKLQRLPVLMAMFRGKVDDAYSYIEAWSEGRPGTGETSPYDVQVRPEQRMALLNALGFHAHGDPVDLTSRRSQMAARAAITTRTVINHEDAAIKDLAHELIRRFGTYVRWGDIARYSHEESDAVESVGEPEVRPESDVSATLAETDVSSMSRKQALRFQRDLTDALEEHLDEIEQYDRMLEELEYKRGAAIRRAEELQSRITEVQESISRALR